jgi:hypothetical protein
MIILIILKSNRKNIRTYFELEVGLEFEFNYYDFEVNKFHLALAPVIGCSKLITDRMNLEVNGKCKISSSGIFTFGINLGLGYLF